MQNKIQKKKKKTQKPEVGTKFSFPAFTPDTATITTFFRLPVVVVMNNGSTIQKPWGKCCKEEITASIMHHQYTLLHGTIIPAPLHHINSPTC